MSGGSYGYIYSRLEEECSNRMYDAEMNDMINDLSVVLHDLEYIALLEKNIDVMTDKFRECSKVARDQYKKGYEKGRADEQAKTINELRSFINKNYENIVFELKSSGKIEDANRVIDKFAEYEKERK